VRRIKSGKLGRSRSDCRYPVPCVNAAAAICECWPFVTCMLRSQRASDPCPMLNASPTLELLHRSRKVAGRTQGGRVATHISTTIVFLCACSSISALPQSTPSHSSIAIAPPSISPSTPEELRTCTLYHEVIDDGWKNVSQSATAQTALTLIVRNASLSNMCHLQRSIPATD
jgi:hypothetical protein